MLVTTLPLTPKRSAPFTTLMSPLVADLAARLTGSVLVISNNCIGRPFNGWDRKAVEDLSSWYLNQLSDLRIAFRFGWSEFTEGYFPFVERVLTELSRSGNLFPSLEDFLRCDCGAVEILTSSIPHIYGRRVIRRDRTGPVCRVCGSSPRCYRADCLILKVPRGGVPSLSPRQKGLSREFQTLASQTAGIGLLVSRSRVENPAVTIAGQRYHLDIDFFWSLHAAYIALVLQERDVVLVASNRNVQQLLLVSRLAHVATPESRVSVLVNPIVAVQGLGTTPALDICAFRQLADPGTLRLLLSHGVAWQRKEVLVDLTWISRLRAATESIEAEAMKDTVVRIERTSLDQFVAVASGETIRSSVASLKKGRRLSAQARHLLYCAVGLSGAPEARIEVH